MKRKLMSGVLPLLMAVSAHAVSSDGIVLKLGLGNGSTTTTVEAEGFSNRKSSGKESAGTTEWYAGYRMDSNMQFGLLSGSVNAEGGSVGYTLATAEYIFADLGGNWRPSVGIGFGQARMKYDDLPGGLELSDSATGLGFAASLAHEGERWSFGAKYQILTATLEGSDTLRPGTAYETKITAKHDGLNSFIFFAGYHF